MRYLLFHGYFIKFAVGNCCSFISLCLRVRVWVWVCVCSFVCLFDNLRFVSPFFVFILFIFDQHTHCWGIDEEMVLPSLPTNMVQYILSLSLCVLCAFCVCVLYAGDTTNHKGRNYIVILMPFIISHTHSPHTDSV